MSNPTDWLQIYHQNLSNHEMNSGQSSVYGDTSLVSVSDATVVSTTTATSIASAATQSQTSAYNLSPDGRVGKPVRRRTRASRRTPTTLLNTDPANFRAMVQQFTGGGGGGAAGVPSNSNVPNFTFGFGASAPVVDTAALMASHGYHQQVFSYQNQQTPFMFSLNNSNSNLTSSAPTGTEAFLQTHGGSRPVAYMGLSDGASLQAPPRTS